MSEYSVILIPEEEKNSIDFIIETVKNRHNKIKELYDIVITGFVIHDNAVSVKTVYDL